MISTTTRIRLGFYVFRAFLVVGITAFMVILSMSLGDAFSAIWMSEMSPWATFSATIAAAALYLAVMVFYLAATAATVCFEEFSRTRIWYRIVN